MAVFLENVRKNISLPEKSTKKYMCKTRANVQFSFIIFFLRKLSQKHREYGVSCENFHEKCKSIKDFHQNVPEMKKFAKFRQNKRYLAFHEKEKVIIVRFNSHADLLILISSMPSHRLCFKQAPYTTQIIMSKFRLEKCACCE